MNKSEKRDIIAAIATPAGRGAISCIRISGEGSARLAEKLTGKDFAAANSNKKYHGKMIHCTFSGRIKDSIMAVVYYGGRSYTGEESAEFYFHGGEELTRQALLSLIDGGARVAEAGEFTRRAFLSGKIDLTQAEGIGDLIDGDNTAMLLSAYEQSEGNIRKTIESIYAETVTLAAQAEVCIDYPEEDIEEQTSSEIESNIKKIIAQIDGEIAGYDGGRIRREGARVVLTGEVNAGKSTLFNTLLASNRAIVCDEEGTTRDTIEEKLVCDGIALVLVDTAGIRETYSRAEKMGIERSLDAVQKADVIVRIARENTATSKETVEDRGKEIKVVNSKQSGEEGHIAADGSIVLNAKTGKGKELLTERILAIVKQKCSHAGCINNARQYAALNEARECLGRALYSLKELTLDCVCADIRGALDALGKITGKKASDEVISEIFSHFCVGK